MDGLLIPFSNFFVLIHVPKPSEKGEKSDYNKELIEP
jgi:hypothetical protein